MTPRHRADAYLQGDERLGCVWIFDTIQSKRFAVLWPNNFRAAFNPVRIYDPKGKVVWREGDVHTLTGGPSEVHVDRVPRGCRVGKLAWWLPSVGVPHPAS